jgi:acyl homoserine lactone synthase
MPDLHEYGPAYFNYLRLRKRFFVDQLKWDIPHDDEFEMDQYDNPQAYYSLVLDQDRVVGGVRLMPTDTQFGPHSYMLRDAQKSKIPGIPDTLFREKFESDLVWEMTRLVMDDRLSTASERNTCLELIGEGLQIIADQTRCMEFVGLTAPTVARALRRLGFFAENIGETYRCAHDGRAYGVMRIPVPQLTDQMAAE